MTRSAIKNTVLAFLQTLTLVFLWAFAPAKAPTEPQNLYKAISIIQLTASKIDFDFEYAFCNWNYAIVLIVLKSKNLT